MATTLVAIATVLLFAAEEVGVLVGEALLLLLLLAVALPLLLPPPPPHAESNPIMPMSDNVDRHDNRCADKRAVDWRTKLGTDETNENKRIIGILSDRSAK